ncbi:Squalene/phytoene synthase [Chytridium lagenaria]|nr:Squalene/phytoene synthase [Chytridium lagenaria]
MRIQFWRDAIADMYKGQVREHPVLTALAFSLEYSDLSQSWFKRILSEREADLEDQQPSTIADLEKYGENTASALLYLQLEAAGIHDHKIDHLASHIGKASTITTLLRATPYHLSNRRICIPAETMAKHLISSEQIFRQGPTQAFNDAVFDVATVAHNHLSTARAHLREMKEKGMWIR